MKNILITGASGFIGSRFVQLAKEKMKGTNIILLTSNPVSDFKCITYDRVYSFTEQDFADIEIDLIDVVIHLGGFVPKLTSEKFNYEKNYANIVNTQYLLTHLPCIPSKIIVCSTADVYGENAGDIFADESTEIHIDNQYSLSKYCCELITKEWSERYGVLCHILRLGPIYGIGDMRENQMIGAFLKRAANGNNLSLFGNPDTKRNLLYIDDLCRFILNAVELNEKIGVINVVSSENPTFKDIVNAVICAADNCISCDVSEQFIPDYDRKFNAEKRIKYLGKEEIDLYDGIKRSLAWVKSCSK